MIKPMRKSLISALSFGTVIALPLLAAAQTNNLNAQSGILNLLGFINAALNDVIVVFITAAIAALFYGAVRYILTNAGGEGKAEGLRIMLYSVIAIFVMVSIWGIINILQNTFGIHDQGYSSLKPSIITTLPAVAPGQ